MIDISKLKYLSSGRNRDVYLLPSGRNVIKVPRNKLGVADNDWEYTFRTLLDPWAKKERVFARCRLIPGTFLLVMEYLEPLRFIDYKHLPDWVGCVDSGQVGYDRKGQLKCYDYGRN